MRTYPPRLLTGARTLRASVGAILVAGLLAGWCRTGWTADFAGGDGSPQNPYLVATAAQLDQVRNHPGASFRQIQEIDLGVAPWNSAAGWVPIGSGNSPFYGRYDGAGLAIRNLAINRQGVPLQGMFGLVRGGTVTGIRLQQAQVAGGRDVGLVAGRAEISTLSHLSASGQVSGVDCVGGLVGRLQGGTLSDSTANAGVTGRDLTGGAVGGVGGAQIARVAAAGSVEGRDFVGGFAGFAGDNLLSLLPLSPKAEAFSTHVEPSADPRTFGVPGGVQVHLPGDVLAEEGVLTVAEYQLEEDDRHLQPGTKIERACEVRIGGGEDLAGTIRIEIPYPPAAVPAGTHPRAAIGALYYNPEARGFTQIPHEVDVDRQAVVIHATHLSTFAVTSRTAAADPSPLALAPEVLYLPSSAYNTDHDLLADAIQALGGRGQPGQPTVGAARQVVNDLFDTAGEELRLGLELLELFNDYLAYFGVGLAFFQLANELDLANPGPEVLAFAMDLGRFAVGQVWGTQAMSFGLVAVVWLNYTVQKFGKTALDGRYELYERAYNYWYANAGVRALPGFRVRSNVDWFQFLRGLAEAEPTPKIEELEAKLDQELDRYVAAFWRDGSGMSFAFGDVAPGFSYTGGSNTAMEQAISRHYKTELVHQLQPVFQTLATHLRNRRYEDLLNRAARARQLYNRIYTIRAVVSGAERAAGQPSAYAGRPVLIETAANQPLWSGVLDEDGTWEMQCSLYAYLRAGGTGRVVLPAAGGAGQGRLEGKFVFNNQRLIVVEIQPAHPLEGTWELEVDYIDSGKVAHAWDDRVHITVPSATAAHVTFPLFGPPAPVGAQLFDTIDQNRMFRITFPSGIEGYLAGPVFATVDGVLAIDGKSWTATMVSYEPSYDIDGNLLRMHVSTYRIRASRSPP